MIDYSFRNLMLHQLYCSILSNNQESMALLRNLGFRQAGIRYDWISLNDGYLDEHLFQLVNPGA